MADEFTNLIDEPAVRAEYESKTEYAPAPLRCPVCADWNDVQEEADNHVGSKRCAERKIQRDGFYAALGTTPTAPTKHHDTIRLSGADGLTLAEWLTILGERGIPATARISHDKAGMHSDSFVFEWEV